LLGLAHEDVKGVRHGMKSIFADLEITVGLAGCASLEDIDRGLLVERNRKMNVFPRNTVASIPDPR
jgi:lactate 2-monooxygenase